LPPSRDACEELVAADCSNLAVVVASGENRLSLGWSSIAVEGGVRGDLDGLC
jgi:hypothetical protein